MKKLKIVKKLAKSKCCWDQHASDCNKVQKGSHDCALLRMWL